MAVATAQSSGEAEVSSCVSNIILAFTDGLNVFKRLRERRKKKKNKHKSSASEHVRDVTSDADLQLRNSLVRGPIELRDRYTQCYQEKGDRFAKGDAIAHRSLAETLIKLNTGLVRIIATFLNCDSNTSNLHLDYRSLISLSEISRREAVESLNQLHYRLSQSQLSVPRVTASKSEHVEKKRTAASRQRLSGPIVARASVKNSNQKQLVMVRPKNSRRGSTTSSSSNSMKSPKPTAVNSASASPSISPLASPLASALDPALLSPLPQYKDLYPSPKTPVSATSKSGKKKAAPSNTQHPATIMSHPRVDKVAPFPTAPHPATIMSHPRVDMSYPRVDKVAPFPTAPHPATITSHSKVDKVAPLPTAPHKMSSARASPTLREKQTPSPPSGAVARRRLDKVTPSSYTFASDSTKLGEIPQHNWTTPWNYEEAERLNAVIAEAGYPVPATGHGKQRKKGLFNFMRRGSAQAA